MTDQEHLANERRKRRSLLIIAITLLVLAVVAYWLWPKKKAAEEEKPEAVVVSVQVAKAERGLIEEKASALGTIFPRLQATVGPKISAPITQMALLKNKPMREGEIIAVLESRDLQAQRTEAVAAVEEARRNANSLSSGTLPQATAQAEKDVQDARANVENARATFERRQVLYERGGISKKDLEAAQLALTTAEDQLRLAERTLNLRNAAINPNDRAAAEAKVRQAEERVSTLTAQLSYANIHAPFSGIITDQFHYKGDFVPAGEKLVNIADLSEVIVKAPFADTVAAKLKIGDAAMVLPTDLPGQQLTGRVSLVSRASDPTNRTVEIWVNLDNRAGRLHANGAAQVIVTTRVVKDAIVVPTAAVTLDASNADAGKVMVVDNKSIAHETKVTVGIRTPEQIEITSGLTEGQTVVTEGSYALPDGTKVQVGEEGKEEGKGEKKDEDDKKDEGKKGTEEKKAGAGEKKESDEKKATGEKKESDEKKGKEEKRDQAPNAKPGGKL